MRETGSLAAALGGLDGFVFTAGIGENDAAVRAKIAAGCRSLGLALDADRNAKGEGVISRDDAEVKVLVVPTDEERHIARYTSKVLGFLANRSEEMGPPAAQRPTLHGCIAGALAPSAAPCAASPGRASASPRLLRKPAMLSEARWLAPDWMCCDRLAE